MLCRATAAAAAIARIAGGFPAFTRASNSHASFPAFPLCETPSTIPRASVPRGCEFLVEAESVPDP